MATPPSSRVQWVAYALTPAPVWVRNPLHGDDLRSPSSRSFGAKRRRAHTDQITESRKARRHRAMFARAAIGPIMMSAPRRQRANAARSRQRHRGEDTDEAPGGR